MNSTRVIALFLLILSGSIGDAAPSLTRTLTTAHSSVAFSPDGKMIASASDDHTIRLWDAATGMQIRVLDARVASRNSTAQSEKEITNKNWQRHPKIIAIRKIVASINASLKKGSFKTARREFECGTGKFPQLRRIARDARGAVKWYEYAYLGEGAEHEYDYHLYYDRAGLLRFVFLDISTGAYRALQVRAYFDDNGKLLKRDYKRFEGGYVGSPLGPDEPEDPVLRQDPARAFASDAEEDCKEIKSQPKRREKNR